MPEFIAQHRVAIIASAIALGFLLIAIFIVFVALKRAKRMTPSPRSMSGDPLPEGKGKNDSSPSPAGRGREGVRVKRTKLAIGDAASPWTQGIYERHAPEGKIDALLMAFAFDEAGGIHRVQNRELIKGVPDSQSLLKSCDTAAGLAIYGVYATLALWHGGSSAYAPLALKVASHAHMDSEEKDLIRFLFQDITAHPLKPLDVGSLTRWKNAAFNAALKLYLSRRVTPQQSEEFKKTLPQEFRRFYELELAQKLPVRTIYREAGESAIFSEGLYRLNLESLRRYMSAKRWLRLKHSDKATHFASWVKHLPCETEGDALLQIANPDVFDRVDLSHELAQRIPEILDRADAHAWLFDRGKKPPLTHRLHYFKFFCLFERYNEAVRCFAFLGVFRRDRATRLYYARALFACGMHHEAWSEMSDLLASFPNDAAVMNEAAIYAHKLGKHEEAAEIFAKARALYPDDATLAYNEAVFAENYSKVQIEQKWSNVQKLTAPPVIE